MRGVAHSPFDVFYYLLADAHAADPLICMGAHVLGPFWLRESKAADVAWKEDFEHVSSTTNAREMTFLGSNLVIFGIKCGQFWSSGGSFWGNLRAHTGHLEPEVAQERKKKQMFQKWLTHLGAFSEPKLVSCWQISQTKMATNFQLILEPFWQGLGVDFRANLGPKTD